MAERVTLFKLSGRRAARGSRPGHGRSARRGGHLPAIDARPGRAGTRAVPESGRAVRHWRAGRPGDGGLERHHCRSPQRHRLGRYAEPPPHLHLHADDGCAGSALRANHSDDARAPRLPGHRRARPDRACSRASTNRVAREAGSFEAGIELALQRLLVSPEFLYRIEADPASTATGADLSHQRLRAGLAAVVLPVEQHPGRRAARGGGERDACAPPPACGPRFAACSRTPKAETLAKQLRRAVAARPQRADRPSGRELRAGVRRHAAAGDAARNRDAARQRHPREPQRHRAADRRLHVPERAAGAATTTSPASRAAISAASSCRPTARAAACSGTAASSPSRRPPSAPRRSFAASGSSTTSSARRRLIRRRTCRRFRQAHAGQGEDRCASAWRSIGRTRAAPRATT